MANEDYQLDEMENAAVDKSKNLKRAAAVGAGVVGAAGAAFAANALVNGEGEDVPDLNPEDLLAGAEAGVEEAVEPQTEEIHVYHHDAPAADPEPEVSIDESAVLFDEDGDVVATFDQGKLDGKNFMVIDNDLNGAGDLLAYDANGNGIYEANEYVELDNRSYEMGQGKNFHMYAENGLGGIQRIDNEVMPGRANYNFVADNNDIDGITNDFEDEKTGEFYHDDLADNNGDYNNNGGEEYSASIDEVHSENSFEEVSYDEKYAQGDMAYEGTEEFTDGGDSYVDNSTDMYADNGSVDTFDDGTIGVG